MKTTVRLTIILPDNYGRIQRLHDDGLHFTLEEEVIAEAGKLADFIEKLKAAGGKMTEGMLMPYKAALRRAADDERGKY